MIEDTHVSPQTEILKGPTQALGGYLVGFEADDGLTIQQDITLGGPVNTSDKVKDGGLTCSIGPDQPPDLAGFDLEIIVIDRPQPTEIMAHIINLKQWHVLSSLLATFL
jgi:hypothetical protein